VGKLEFKEMMVDFSDVNKIVIATYVLSAIRILQLASENVKNSSHSKSKQQPQLNIMNLK